MCFGPLSHRFVSRPVCVFFPASTKQTHETGVFWKPRFAGYESPRLSANVSTKMLKG